MNVSFIFVFTIGLKYVYVYLHRTILSKRVWLHVNLRLRLILFILLWWKIVWSASLSICPRASLLASVSRVGIFFYYRVVCKGNNDIVLYFWSKKYHKLLHFLAYFMAIFVLSRFKQCCKTQKEKIRKKHLSYILR